MTFWQIFLRVLPKRPKDALAALFWHITGRRLRARNRLRAASASLPLGYELWIATVERTPEVVRRAAKTIETLAWRPRFLILMYRADSCTDEQVARSLRSAERQIYPHWTLIDCSKPGAEITTGDADFIVPLLAGDALSETALFRFAEALQADRSLEILYGDQDKLDRRGRRTRPWFKPSWNAEMFLALDYVSRAVAVRATTARRVGIESPTLTPNSLTEALLKATLAPEGPIAHVPHILCHVDPTTGGIEPTKRAHLVSEHLQSHSATCAAGPFGTLKVSWPLPADLPKVSIVIPTKDKVDLLRACVDSVLQLTSYRGFEIIIVDNQSADPETFAYFDRISQPSVRVLRYDKPYNFSAINNFAARHAEGTYLCLLNNDTEVIEPEWLTEMVRYAIRPEIGAVGAKLLYGDGTIQHAGIVLGMGDAAGHAHRFEPSDQPGYFGQHHVAQFITAVTAACLVVEKQKFESVGGFDETNLAIAYNDVDLCLKLQEAGWKNVYVPHAQLLHHESKSRDSDLSPPQHERYFRELRVLQERWQTRTFQDPLHNPNLDRYSETFTLRLGEI